MKRLTLLTVLLCSFSAIGWSIPSPNVFLKNDGRWPAHVLYMAPTQGGTMWITTEGFTIDVPTATHMPSNRISYNLEGARGMVTVTDLSPTERPAVGMVTPKGIVNFSTATHIVVNDVAPGISLEYLWENERIRYNVLVAPGTPVPSPMFSVKGALAQRSTMNGIVTDCGVGLVEMTDIVSTQPSAPSIPTRWSVSNTSITFHVADYDRSKQLVIDPLVTLLRIEGNMEESITGVQRRSDGKYVIAGYTTSDAFNGTVANNAAGTKQPGVEGFVALLSANLSTVEAWLWLGGSGDDWIKDLSLYANGTICVAGRTTSTNFPTMGSQMGKTAYGNGDGFVTIISADLKTVTTSLYIGGLGNDDIRSVVVNTVGQIVMVGSTTTSTRFLATKYYDDTLRGGADAFVYVLNASLSTADFFSYMGGSQEDVFTSVAIGDNNSINICGTVRSDNFKIVPRKTLVSGGYDPYTYEEVWIEVGDDPYDATFNGGNTDVIVVKFSAAGDIEFSTYFGGSGNDEAVDVVVNADKSIMVIGNTSSADLPIDDASARFAGGTDVFVCVLAPDGMKKRNSGVFGGYDEDRVGAVVKAGADKALIVGTTQSTDLPITGVGAIGYDAGSAGSFLAMLTPNSHTYSTLFNQLANAMPTAVTLDTYGDAVFAGRIMLDAPEPGNSSNAFVTKWAFGALTYRSPGAGEVLCAGQSVTVRWETQEISNQETFTIELMAEGDETSTTIASGIVGRTYTFTLPETLDPNRKYRIRIIGMRGHVAESPVNGLSAALPIVINTQPIGVVACPNREVVLSVDAAGSNATFAWRKDGRNITGAHGSTYTISSAQVSDNGTYDVVVTGTCGSVTSSPAVLLISDKPVIDKQPQAASVNAGATASMTVEARGEGLTYKWFLNGGPVRGGHPTSATLTLDNVTKADEGDYTCEITSACGTTTTEPATLTVTGTSSVRYGTWADGTPIVLYPQPATNVLSVPLGTSAATHIVVRDINGQELLRNQIPSGSQNAVINLASHPTGMYMIEVHTPELVFTTTAVLIR